MISTEGFYTVFETVFAKQNVNFVIVALLANFIIDYTSLLETRVVLRLLKTDSQWHTVAILLLMDVVFTLFIFIVGAAIFKSLLDIAILSPYLRLNDAVQIFSAHSGNFALQADDSFWHNLFSYTFYNVKVNMMSMLIVLHDIKKSYWTFSLYLHESSVYTIPASTFWATTHLSTVFIVVYIVFWMLSIIPNTKKIYMPELSFRPKIFKYTVEEYPVTVLGLKLFMWFSVLQLVSILAF